VPVAQEEGPVDKVADPGELVRRDDGRDATLGRLVHRSGDGRSAFEMSGIIEKHDVAHVRCRTPSVRHGRDGHQARLLAMLDCAGVDAAEAGETVEQRGRSRSPSAEDGDAFSLAYLEAGGAQHPHARGAPRHASGVALPEGVGAEGERHDRTMCRAPLEPTSRRGNANETGARAALRPLAPVASYATQSIDVTSGGSPCRWKEPDRSTV